MKVKELLSDRERWIQNTMAVNTKGETVRFSDPEACAFCLLGAVYKCYENTEDYVCIIEDIEEIVERNVGGFNDCSTYEEVMEVVEALNI